MGIDAEMYVRTDSPLNAEQTRRLSYELVAAMGRKPFWLDRERDQHALTVDSDGVLEIHLMGRYYGEGYERGHWPYYGAIMRFLRVRLPGCRIYYGGDTHMLDELDVFTLEDEDAMWTHWAEAQTRPYNIFMGNVGSDDIPTPRCDFCREPMTRGGFGSGYGSFYCYCGERRETRDGGKTWATLPRQDA